MDTYTVTQWRQCFICQSFHRYEVLEEVRACDLPALTLYALRDDTIIIERIERNEPKA